MVVRNIFVVEPDPDRWQPSMPAFKKVIVGPLTWEPENASVLRHVVNAFWNASELWWWVVLPATVALAIIVVRIWGGKP